MIINELLELRAYVHWCLTMLRLKRMGRGLPAIASGSADLTEKQFRQVEQSMQKIFLDVGAQYADKLAQAQADKAAGAMKAMEEAGAKVIYLSDAERKRWAEKLPNVAMDWAESMEQKGMPGKKVLQGYLDGLRQRGTVLVRDWDK